MDLFVEEVFNEHVAGDSASNVGIVDFGLLEEGSEVILKGKVNGWLDLFVVEPEIPILEQVSSKDVEVSQVLSFLMSLFDHVQY